MRFSLPAAIALVVAQVLATACIQQDKPQGPSPIEQMLAQDSALRASQGDSSVRHIAFDYENLNRAGWQKPEAVLDLFGGLSNKTVVEIGSGTGFFTRRLAQRAAHVLALDIAPDMLIVLDSLNASELDTAAYNRIEPRLVRADNPGLAPAEADAALVVNTFMYIHNGKEYLIRLAEGLKPGAMIIVVDFKTQNTPVGPPVASRMPIGRVIEALRDAGYQNIATNDHLLDYQYIVTAIR